MVTLLQAKKYFQKTPFWNPKCSVTQIKESTNNKVFTHNNVILKEYTHKENYAFEKQCIQNLSLKKKPYFPRILLDDQKNNSMLFTSLSGKTLDKIWLKLSKSKQLIFIDKLIKVLKELHTIQAPVGYTIEKYLQNEVEKYYKKANKNPNISKKDIADLYEYVIKNLTVFSKEKQILIYSDFWVKNILSDGNDITGIIDFETGCYGPLCLEGYKIQHTLFSIKDGGDDTSPAEQDFMKQFVMHAKKTYPKLFVSTLKQKKIYQGIHYMKILSRWEEKRYNHDEVEKFRKEFL